METYPCPFPIRCRTGGSLFWGPGGLVRVRSERLLVSLSKHKSEWSAPELRTEDRVATTDTPCRGFVETRVEEGLLSRVIECPKLFLPPTPLVTPSDSDSPLHITVHPDTLTSSPLPT